MSAQGATLGRGTVRIPIWPVAVVVLVAIAAVIGLSSIDTIGTIAPARTLVTVTDAQRLANSTAAVREQGATLPVAVGISHVAPRLHASTGYSGFENPAASGAVVWGSIGGPNEALHRQYSPPQDGAASAHTWGPIMVNGEPCMQCK
jgi:hypothetical protein